MSSLTIGRLVVGAPLLHQEQWGDSVTNLGGAPIPAPRTALRHQVSIGTFAPDGAADTIAARLIIRRAMRSMLNNSPLKLAGGLYFQYSDDPEQNGWYVPDMGQLVDLEGVSGLATGAWKLENVVWMLVGHPRTHRQAANVWAKDLRSGLSPRDFLKLLYSTDFSALVALSFTYLPAGASDIINSVNGIPALNTLLAAGSDTGRVVVVPGQVDLATLSFEQPDSSRNFGDVVVYDRRGNLTALPTP